MTEDEWIEYYEPIMDAVNDTDLWDIDDPLINVIKREHIWTLVDGDDGNGCIVPGFVFTNRIGFYITTKPYDKFNRPEPIKCIFQEVK